MKLSVLLQGIAPVEECDDVEVAGIATDSRKVKKGDLFVCMNGVHGDGHEYADDAVNAGAVAIK